MAEELLINVNVQGEESVPKLDENLDKIVKNTKKTTSAIADLRKEMKDAKSDMLKYAEGTDEYNAAMKRAAQGADKMADINGKLKASQRDIGVISKNVAGSISGLAAGFATAQGVIALFGVENEQVSQTMLKMQAALNVTQGLANFVDAFDTMKDLYRSIKMSIFETATAKNVDTIATNANTIAVEANNIANQSNVKGVNDQNKAVTELSKSTGEYGKEATVLGSNLAGIGQVQKELTKNTISNRNALEGFRKSSIGGGIGGDADRAAQARAEQVKLNTTLQEGTKASGSFIGSMGKNLLTMGAYAVVIGGAIFAITKLIEWMNKVPDDLKIKIEIETEAINKTKTLREDILKFQSDYSKAQKASDKETIKGLDEIAKKQYGLSEAQINTINHTADGWTKFFEEYIRMAEDTYYNESLIKKKVDLELQKNLAQNEIDSIKASGKVSDDQMKSWIKVAKNKNVIAKLGSDLVTFGVGQDVLDATRSIDEIEKKLKDLDRLKPKTSANYFSNIGEIKTTKENKSVNTTESFTVDMSKEEMSKKLAEINKAYSESSKNINYKNNLSLIGTDKDANYELSKLQELYDKGKLTTEEYLKEKYELIKSYEDRGIDLTETAFNAQAAMVEDAEARKQKAIEKTMFMIQSSFDTANQVTSALGELNKAELDSENAKYDKKDESIEQNYQKEVDIINKSKKSQEDKDKALIDLDNNRLKEEQANDEDRYQMQVKNLELLKKIQIAQLWINTAAGIVGIWSKSWEGGLFAGPILAGIQTAALLVTAAAQTKAINAQRIEAPVKTASSTSSSSSSSSTATSTAMLNAKLNPTKTSLTSKEENLNMMNSSGQRLNQSVVKVSDINKVQNTVTVRNNNVSF